MVYGMWLPWNVVSCPDVMRSRARIMGCTKTRNGEIRNGKWGVEDKGVAARGSAVTHKQWQRQRIGEGKCACQSK